MTNPETNFIINSNMSKALAWNNIVTELTFAVEVLYEFDAY